MSATEPAPESAPPFTLEPASRFTIEALTAAYNQTRVDYLVPMPMNTARLAEYIATYDVDLERSAVAVMNGQIAGLGMLGVRPGRTWITRLGVVPGDRRHGLGRALMEALLRASIALSVQHIVLEVIKNNLPAHKLFMRCGFQETRELLILRRPPAPPAHPPTGEYRWLDRAEALAALDEKPESPSWVTEKASLEHADHLMGLSGRLPDGSEGWVVFQEQRFRMFPTSLARVTLHTRRGDPVTTGCALLTGMYHHYPELDTQTENIPAEDPHIPSLFEMGYVESFRRIEMHRPGEPQP
jgi:ribosomal protein S18 acetylase RimI-like enzyme